MNTARQSARQDEVAEWAAVEARLRIKEERLLRALTAIRDMEPEPVAFEVPSHADCPECARYAAMPPHTLPGGSRVCDDLYRALRRRDQLREQAEQAQHWRMRGIARHALEPDHD